MKLNVLCLMVLASAASSALFAGSAPIGIVSAVASYSINDKTSTGATSVADGMTVSTTTAPSDIRLDNGAQIRLATRSTGTVFNDHLALNEGAVRVGDFTDYSIQIHNLQVVGDSPSAAAIVRVHGDKVEVASIGGSVSVSDGGAMMTRVAAGTRVAFRAQDTSQTQPQSKSVTGAAPGEVGQERNTLLWTVIGVSGAAAIIGGIAAYQGKDPF